jgi:hypothetical protein
MICSVQLCSRFVCHVTLCVYVCMYVGEGEGMFAVRMCTCYALHAIRLVQVSIYILVTCITPMYYTVCSIFSVYVYVLGVYISRVLYIFCLYTCVHACVEKRCAHCVAVLCKVPYTCMHDQEQACMRGAFGCDILSVVRTYIHIYTYTHTLEYIRPTLRLPNVSILCHSHCVAMYACVTVTM